MHSFDFYHVEFETNQPVDNCWRGRTRQSWACFRSPSRQTSATNFRDRYTGSMASSC